MVVAAFLADMRTTAAIGIIAAVFVALSLAAFGGAPAPEQPASSGQARTKGEPKSLAASRIFMLLPDGKVEITDAWARRVFRWDGKRWVEVEVIRLETPRVDSR